MGDQSNQVELGEAPKKKSTLFVAVAIVAGLALLIVGGLSMLPDPRLKANEIQCRMHLKNIGLAARQYADENRFFPYDPSDPTGRKAMEVLVTKHLIDERDLFNCPCSPLDGFSYDGFPVPRAASAPSDTPLAWDRNPHPDGTRNVLFVDSHIGRVSEADFPEILAKAKAPAK